MRSCTLPIKYTVTGITWKPTKINCSTKLYSFRIVKGSFRWWWNLKYVMMSLRMCQKRGAAVIVALSLKRREALFYDRSQHHSYIHTKLYVMCFYLASFSWYNVIHLWLYCGIVDSLLRLAAVDVWLGRFYRYLRLPLQLLFSSLWSWPDEAIDMCLILSFSMLDDSYIKAKWQLVLCLWLYR